MENDRQSYLDWLDNIKGKAYDYTHPNLPPCPTGMKPERYEAIKRRLNILYAPMTQAFSEFTSTYERCFDEISKSLETGDDARRTADRKSVV